MIVPVLTLWFRLAITATLAASTALGALLGTLVGGCLPQAALGGLPGH